MNGTEALAVINGNETPVYPLKGGRPSRAEVRALQKAKARLERQIAKHTKKVAVTYVALAAGGKINRGVDPATTRHFVDKLIPNARPELGPGEAAFLVGAGMILADYLLNRGKVPLDVVSEPEPDIITTAAAE